MMHEVWIGDYSVLIWVPKDKDPKEIIQKTINTSIAQYGLRVVKA